MGTRETTNRLWRGWAISAGFTIIEVAVVTALLGVVTAIGFPLYLSFQRAQETDGAARTIVTLLNQARQLAITRGTSFGVEAQTNPVNLIRFCSGPTVPCPTTFWTGAGTDGSGWRPLGNAARIVLGPAIVFSSLGAATASGTLRVQNSSATGCLDVVVSPSGRIRITAPAACP